MAIKEEPCGSFKMWIQVCCGLYIADLTISMNQLMHLKKKYHENVWLLLCSLVMLVVCAGWYVYGNVIYYKHRNHCSNEVDAINLTQTMWIMVLIGYMTLLKCCCFTSCLIYFVPIIIQVYRQQRNYGWEAAGPQLLRNLQKGKFKPEDFGDDGTKECIICFVQYEEGDELITLPCDNRHIFHEKCIETWLKSNNTCPLCKTPIT